MEWVLTGCDVGGDITQFANMVQKRETLDGPRKRPRMDTAPQDNRPTTVNVSKIGSLPRKVETFGGEGWGGGPLR